MKVLRFMKKNKKILILGGNGFIGTQLTRRLASDGHHVRVLSRKKKDERIIASNNVEYYVGDFERKADIYQACKNIDVVYHLISTTIPSNSIDNPLFDIETNITPSVNLLEIMKEYSIKKLIYCSSGGAIYGKSHSFPITEQQITNPETPYGIGKLCIEKFIDFYKNKYNMNCIILRLSNPYGPDQNTKKTNGLVSKAIIAALNKNPLTIYGDGSTVRDYVFIDDAINAFLLALNYKGEKSLFNISTGHGYSINELIDLIESISKLDIKKIFMPKRTCDIEKNVLDNSLAIKELKWKPITPIEDGLKLTLRYYKGIM